MKKITAILALSLIGFALIGCGPKEETGTTGTGADTSAGKMEEKGGTQTPTDK